MTMLQRILRSAALSSAARKYARCLGSRLRQDYGGGEHYSAGQIKAAAEKCRLPLRHIYIGYAAFMSEAAFVETTHRDDYQSLRLLFFRHETAKANSAFSPAPENWYATGAGDSN